MQITIAYGQQTYQYFVHMLNNDSQHILFPLLSFSEKKTKADTTYYTESGFKRPGERGRNRENENFGIATHGRDLVA
jgi:hypothetical protein